MYYQKYEGIYLYFVREEFDNATDGNYRFKVNVLRYPTLEHFFWLYRDSEIAEEIGYTIYDNRCNKTVAVEYGHGCHGRHYVKRKIKCGKINCTEHSIKGNRMSVIYDQDGNQYTPDHLIGLRRAWIADRAASKDYRYRYSKRHGHKKRPWGGYRKIKTTQERKWACAWDDEEFAPKTRACRQGKNLPDSWDDCYSHSDKSWKTQSNRKRQWKAK